MSPVKSRSRDSGLSSGRARFWVGLCAVPVLGTEVPAGSPEVCVTHVKVEHLVMNDTNVAPYV